MENSLTASVGMAPTLKAKHVYTMAVISLLAGLGIGYLMRSSQLSVSAAHPGTRTSSLSSTSSNPHHPSLGEIRQIADQQAAPLIEKLKSNPNDSASLVQVGAIYHSSHRFKEAADYYGRALTLDPKNVAVRTKLASSLYRNGNIDGAISELNKALAYQPNDANALFDLGMIRLQGKGDARGAISSWQRLLKTNPTLSPDRRATVMKLMADTMTMMGDQNGLKNQRRNHERE